jgi:hypothetical protein
MAISVVQSAKGAIGHGPTLTITLGAAPTNGNVMIALVGAAANSTYNTPAGWTLLDSDPTHQNDSFYCFYKVASGDTAAQSFVLTSGAQAMVGTLVEVTGQDALAPFNQHNQQAYSTLTSPQTVQTNAKTPSVLGCLPIAFFIVSNTSAYTPSWTEDQNVQSQPGCELQHNTPTVDTVTAITGQVILATARNGHAEIILIAPQFALSGNVLNFNGTGASGQGVTASGGSGSYTAISSNAAVATVAVSGSTVTITPGGSAGTATITVKDSNLQALTITVYVSSGNVVPSPTSMTFATPTSSAQTATVAETGYSQGYTATSTNNAVATVSPGSGNGPFTVTPGGTAGTCSIKFEDAYNNTGSIAVTVNAGGATGPLLVFPNNIAFSQASLGSEAGIVVSETGFAGTFTAVSSNTGVATVTPSSASGPGPAVFEVAPVAAGSCTVTIADGHGGSLVVNVTVSFSAFAVVPTTITFTSPFGAPQTVTASGGVVPYTATSSDPTKATVAVAAGVVTITPVNTGTVTVTVYDNNNPQSSVAITVNIASGVVAASPSSLTFTSPTAGTQTTTPSETGYVGNFTASIDNTNVATVSPASGSGAFTVTPVSAGTCNLTFTDTNGNSTVVPITVSAGIVVVTPNTLSFAKPTAAAKTFTASEGGYSGTWANSSSNGAIATVATPVANASAITVTPHAAGSCTISASDGTNVGHVGVNVASGVPIASPAGPINFASPTGSQVITVSETGYVGTFNASSSNSAVATVSFKNGVFTVTAVGAGTCTVTFTDSNGNSVVVTVNVAAGFITCAPGSVAFPFPTAPTQQIAPSETGYTGNFTVSSSAPSVATVSPSSGVGPFTVTPVAAGSCNINISDSNGNTLAVPITVASGQVLLSPGNLTFPSANAAAQTVTITESGYSGSFTATVTGPSGILAPPFIIGNTLTVQPNVSNPNGGVTAVKVTDTNGNSATLSVTVYGALAPSPASLFFSSAFASPQTFVLNEPAFGGPFTVTSASPSIATVTPGSANGPGPVTFTVTPVGGGVATINIVDSNNKTAVVTATVGIGYGGISPFVTLTQIYNPNGQFLQTMEFLAAPKPLRKAQWDDTALGGCGKAAFELLQPMENTTNIQGGNWIYYGCGGGKLTAPVSAGGTTIALDNTTQFMQGDWQNSMAGDGPGGAGTQYVMIDSGGFREFFPINAVNPTQIVSSVPLANSYPVGAVVCVVRYAGIIQSRDRGVALSNEYVINAVGFYDRLTDQLVDYTIQNQECTFVIAGILAQYAVNLPDLGVGALPVTNTLYSGTGQSQTLESLLLDVLRVANGGVANTTIAAGSSVTSTGVPVWVTPTPITGFSGLNGTSIAVGSQLQIGTSGNTELVTVLAISATQFQAVYTNTHPTGDAITTPAPQTYTLVVDARRRVNMYPMPTTTPTVSIDLKDGAIPSNTFHDYIADMKITDQDISSLSNSLRIQGGTKADGSQLQIYVDDTLSEGFFHQKQIVVSNQYLVDDLAAAAWGKGTLRTLAYPKVSGSTSLMTASLNVSSRAYVQVTGFDDGTTFDYNPPSVTFLVDADGITSATMQVAQLLPDINAWMREIINQKVFSTQQAQPPSPITNGIVQGCGITWQAGSGTPGTVTIDGGIVVVAGTRITTSPVSLNGVNNSTIYYWWNNLTSAMVGLVHASPQSSDGFTSGQGVYIGKVTIWNNQLAGITQQGYAGLGTVNFLDPPNSFVFPGIASIGIGLTAEGINAVRAVVDVTLNPIAIGPWVTEYVVTWAVAGSGNWQPPLTAVSYAFGSSFEFTIHGLASGQSYDIGMQIRSTSGTLAPSAPALLTATSPSIAAGAINTAISMVPGILGNDGAAPFGGSEKNTVFNGGMTIYTPPTGVAGTRSGGLIRVNDKDHNGVQQVMPTGWARGFEGVNGVAYQVGPGAAWPAPFSPPDSLILTDAQGQTGQNCTVACDGFPVRAGRNYAFLADVYPGIGSALPSGAQWYFRAVWYKSTATDFSRGSSDVISISDYNGGAQTSHTAQIAIFFAQAPANAGFCRIAFYKWSSAPVTSTWSLMVTNVRCYDTTSTSLNGQGSIPPVGGAPTYTYSSAGGASGGSNASITIQMSAGTYYLPDGSSIVVPTQAPKVLGGLVQSATYYVDWAWDIPTSQFVYFTYLTTPASPVQYMSDCNADGRIGVEINKQIATPAANGSGSGGGGGDPACPADYQFMEIRDESAKTGSRMVRAGDLQVGDYLRDPHEGWNRILSVGLEPCTLWRISTDRGAVDVNDTHLTMMADGAWRKPCDLRPGDKLAPFGGNPGAIVQRCYEVGPGRYVPIECIRHRYVIGGIIGHNRTGPVCPDVDQLITIRGETDEMHIQVRAGDLEPGMCLLDPTGSWNLVYGMTVRPTIIWRIVTDVEEVRVNETHLVMLENGEWRLVTELKRGDIVKAPDGMEPTKVLFAERVGPGEYAAISCHRNRYVLGKTIGHNTTQ